MAQEIGSAYVTLLPSARGFGKAAEGEMSGAYGKSEKQGKGFFSRLGGLAKGFGVVVAGAVGVVAGLAAKGGISRALNIEDAQAKLKGLGHDTQVIEAIMTDALASVKGTAFGLDAAAGVAATAIAAGIKPGQELERYLRLTADAATIAGTSLDDMGSILNKVAIRGRVTAREINQLQERNIPIMEYLAAEYGVTAEALEKMVSKGEIDSKRFQKAIEDNIGGAALASGDTTRGAFANMMAALSRLGEMFLGEGLGPARLFFLEITSLLDNINIKLRPWADEIKKRLGDAFQIEGLGDRALAGLERMLDFWTNGAGGDLLNTLAPAAALMRDLGGQILEALAPAIEELGRALKPVLPMLSEALVDAVIELAPAMTDLLIALIPLIPELVKLAVEILPPMVSLLGELTPLLSDVLGLLTDIVAIDVAGIALLFGFLTGENDMDETARGIEEIWQSMGTLGDFARTTFEVFLGYIHGLRTGFFTLRTGVDEVIGGLKEAWADFGLFLGDTLRIIFGIFTGNSDLMLSGATRFRDRFAAIWSGIASDLRSTTEGMWLATVGRFVSGVAQAVGPVEALPARLIGIFSNARSWLLNAGRDIIQGLIMGVVSKAAEAVATVRNIAGNMVDGAKSFLGIRSPSRVFRDEVGKMIGAGLIEGVDAMHAQVDASISGLVAVPSASSTPNGGSDRPIYADGVGLLGWLRDIAGQHAEFIFNTGLSDMALQVEGGRTL